MPIYEYHCTRHGTFDELRTFADAEGPMPCPDCGESSPRIVSIPRFRQLAAGIVSAMDRNEKSQHEPRVSSCGCRPKASATGGEPAKPKRQAYTGPRPWVIEHA